MVTMATRVINGQKNPTLDEEVKRRVGLAMSKFAERIESVEVRLKESRRKATEKICTIEVKMTPRGRIRVSSKKNDLGAAAFDAIRRAELQVCRDLERHQRGQNLRHRKQGLRQETRQWAVLLAATT
jgi:hypothetical protein